MLAQLKGQRESRTYARRTVFALLLALVLLTTPLSFASAQIDSLEDVSRAIPQGRLGIELVRTAWGWLDDRAQEKIEEAVIDPLVEFITEAAAQLLIVIPAFVFFLVSSLTNWIIGNVLEIPIVPGSQLGEPPSFVQTGWELSRNIINSVLLLMVAFIGLATIFRWQSYQFQKTLPILLIIALLVNFSAVLVGVTVDIANIITKFFFDLAGKELSTTGFTKIFATTNITLELLEKRGDPSPIELFTSGVAYGVAVSIFYIISAIAFFVVGTLFLLRTVILWTLTVLAPLAFGAYILPATRRFWNQWLHALIQWAFLGVPIAFFMFLAGEVLQQNSSAILGSPPSTVGGSDIANATALANIIGMMLAPFVGVVLLLIGVGISMSFAPAGARTAINLANKGRRNLMNTRAGRRLQAGLYKGTRKTLGGLAGGRAGWAGAVGAGAGRGLAFALGRNEEVKQKWSKTGRAIGGTAGNVLGGAVFKPIHRAAAPKLIEMEARAGQLQVPDAIRNGTPEQQEAWAASSNLAGKDLVRFGEITGGNLADVSGAFQNKIARAADQFANEMRGAATKIFRVLPQNMGGVETLRKLKPQNADDLMEETANAARLTGTNGAFNVKAAQVILDDEGHSLNKALKEALQSEGRPTTSKDLEGLGEGAAEAVSAAFARLTDKQKERFNGEVENATAIAAWVKDFKPQHYNEIADPKDISIRMATWMGNPTNIQRLQDNFGVGTVKDVIEGIGGLNDATRNEGAIRELSRVNHRILRWLENTPAGRAIDVANRGAIDRFVIENPQGVRGVAPRQQRGAGEAQAEEAEEAEEGFMGRAGERRSEEDRGEGFQGRA